jgi:hypothetical protein
MPFAHPILLAAGLAALAIPILIHLLMRRRRKPVRWAAMRFLVEAYRRQRRRRRIEQVLLLTLRCLVVALLAVAIARLALGDRAERGATTLVLVIDNSLTSALTDADTNIALARLTDAALNELDRISPERGDRVAVIAGGGPATALVSPATLARDAARRIIETIEPTDSTFDLGGALRLASLSIPPETRGIRVVVLSDWRRGTDPDDGHDAEPPAWAIGADRVRLIASRPAADEVPNLRLAPFTPARDALFPMDTPAATQAIVTVEREGTDLPRVGATLRVEGIGAGVSAEQPVVLPEGRRSVRVPFTLPLPAADNLDLALRVSLHADGSADRLANDSVSLRAVRLPETVRVGLIDARRGTRPVAGFEASDWARVALTPEPLTPVRVVELDAAGLQADDLAGLDAALLTRPDLLAEAGWAALRVLVQRGGTLVVFPPADATVHRWGDPFRETLSAEGEFSREAVAFDPPVRLAPAPASAVLTMLSGELEGLARGVTVSRMLAISGARAGAALVTESGAPFLVTPAPRVWVFAAALDPSWTDLPAKPLFVPLLQEIVRRAAAPTRPATVTAGARFEAPAPSVELIEPDSGARVVPSPETGAFAPIRRAGVWTARSARGERLGLIVVSPDHAAGRTEPSPPERVVERLRAAAPGVEPGWIEGDDGSGGSVRDARPDDAHAWIPFVLAALVALGESFIARRIARGGAEAVSP